MEEIIYDLAGVGIGPFNLGLAALCEPIECLQAIFFDQQEKFEWHPGMMLEGTTLQVAFYADLVTLADPCSAFSYLNYLKKRGRLIQFGIHENNYISRLQYNRYCQWVCSQLSSLNFNHQVISIEYNEPKKCYDLQVLTKNSTEKKIFHTRRLIIGIGSSSHVPSFVKPFLGDNVFHSSEFLFHRGKLLKQHAVSIIGSGQSAAEIFYDLLCHTNQFSEGLFWFTRSDRFFPMDLSKLCLEMTSPDYIRYFYNLPPQIKKSTLEKQDMLYKGINVELINRIYDRLYELNEAERNLPVKLFPNCCLTDLHKNAPDDYLLRFYHREQHRAFMHHSQALILATGYEQLIPEFLEPIKNRIRWEKDGNYSVLMNYSIDLSGKEIFVQNAEINSHGFNAPDLCLGPYRNAIILKEILGYEHYPIEKNIAFQQFGVPEN
jgi:putrescine N-hydroxylase